jgi:hypothetical protein
VPEVIALDISEFELPHLILTFMDGKPSRDSIAAHDGGAWLRRVHSMELPSWGPLVIERDQVPPVVAIGHRARPYPISCPDFASWWRQGPSIAPVRSGAMHALVAESCSGKPPIITVMLPSQPSPAVARG